MTSALSLPLGAPGFPLSAFAGSIGSTGLVPGVFPVALAGTPFHLDHSDGPGSGLRYITAARIRQQADSGQRPGEQSLNPEGDWRRSFATWYSGAGQDNADDEQALFSRYFSSKGIDPWTEGEITLLPDVDESLNMTATNNVLATLGSRLYVADTNTLRYTTDPFVVSPTYTAVTGTPGSAIVGLAPAGHYLFVGYGTNGIYITNEGSGAASSWVTGTVDGVYYAKGRVLATNNAAVYNPTTSWTGGPAALPTALFTHPNPNWQWVGMAEGQNHIYLAGYAGDASEVYRTEVKADGTALDVPVVAGRLPEGEIIRSIGSYLLDWVLLGTDLGVRVATQDANGNLLIGPLIETGGPVNDFEGQGRFVWFTWNGFDQSSNGLGRIDLTSVTQRNAPAYASDLMVTTALAVLSVTTFSEKRVFTTSTGSLYVQSDDLVATGTLDTGDIRFGLTELKLSKSVVQTTLPLAETGGSAGVAISNNSGGSWMFLGTQVAGSTKEFSTSEMLAPSHRLRITLNRDAADATRGPTYTGVSLRVHPHTDSTRYWVARLVLSSVNQAQTGYVTASPAEQLASVAALHNTQSIVTWQSLGVAYSVTVEDFNFEAHTHDSNIGESGWGGTLTVKLKVV